jgi:membrane-associated phospholipid phosphatase
VPFIVSVGLLRRGRREELLTVAAAVALTYFVNFALFFCIPALGPRTAPEIAGLHHAQYHGPLFARLCRLAEGDAGPVVGAVFPSSHVSAALAWGLATFRFDRRLSLIAIGLAAGIMPSTVYLGYHFAIDCVAGALLPLATVPLAFAMARRRGEIVSTTLERA